MEVSVATCGTERMIECEIQCTDNNYTVNIEGILFNQWQQVYGLGFYEEKALKNALKQLKNKKIVQQIKKQFKLK